MIYALIGLSCALIGVFGYLLYLGKQQGKTETELDAARGVLNDVSKVNRAINSLPNNSDVVDKLRDKYKRE